MNRFVVSTVLLLATANLLSAADWPAFRGPNGDGFAADNKAPVNWSVSENVAWKAELPRPGNGSPIVAAGRVFVTSAEDKEGKHRSLYCFDRKNGKQLWVRTVDVDEKISSHKTNPYCGSTPACDGERVVVFHGSAGLYCYNLDGKQLWSRKLNNVRHMWGYGSSPFFYKDKIILNAGPGKDVFLTAIDPSNGESIWTTDEPIEGDGNRRSDGSPMGSWCTPIITKVDGKDQIICLMPTRVNAYDLQSGDIVWSCEGLVHNNGNLVYSSAVIAGDLCFVTGGYRGPTMAIRLGGSGNVTKSHRLYRHENSPQSIGSGVAIDGYVYRPNAGGPAIQCIDSKTGKIIWSQRGDGANWGSIVSAGGLLYVTSKKGTTLVFRPNPKKYEEVARNKLDERSNSTLAISDDHIFIRTDGHMFCIGK